MLKNTAVTPLSQDLQLAVSLEGHVGAVDLPEPRGLSCCTSHDLTVQTDTQHHGNIITVGQCVCPPSLLHGRHVSPGAAWRERQGAKRRGQTPDQLVEAPLGECLLLPGKRGTEPATWVQGELCSRGRPPLCGAQDS